MASFEVGGSTEPSQPLEFGRAVPDDRPTETADPYEATVGRLFALLEENQVAIATLAQAWRHTSRALELTQAELSRTQDMLAAERLNSQHPADEAPARSHTAA
jgi:hypothetical protein